MKSRNYLFLIIFCVIASSTTSLGNVKGKIYSNIGGKEQLLKEDKTDDQIMEDLFRNSYRFYQKLRHTNGAYFDMVKLEGTTDRGSVANIGMGLMSLCVGHEMGWEPQAESMVLQTLKAVSGEVDGFNLARNDKGCFIHFYDINTGDARGTNFSPIDSDLLIGGALFAKRYFNKNTEIASYVDNIFNSTDHSVFIGDVNKGQVALGMNPDGTPNGNWTIPYNEYMIVAWLAKNQSNDSNSPANQLWNNFYSSPNNLKHCIYPGEDGTDYPVLSPSYERFTSMFTFMFNHNFVHPFASKKDYQEEMLNAMKADSAWWADRTELETLGKKSYEWGTGAGVGAPASKYMVDRICLPQNVNTSKDQNQSRNVSPHVMAGFSPVAPERVRQDILSMYKDSRDVGKVDLEPGVTILWKYSYSDLSWKPNKVEGVDYSCMVFGLAALPQFLGPEFFQVYNDFFNPEEPVYKKITASEVIKKKSSIKIWPNPTCSVINVTGLKQFKTVNAEICDLSGSVIRSFCSKVYGSEFQVSVTDLNSGLYLIKVHTTTGELFTSKFYKK